ncbi:MAG: hypothetical protein K2L93_06395 [Muribaculaceae bacterium]|nr:hypothetical protein [Muribaculaceae bacterium]
MSEYLNLIPKCPFKPKSWQSKAWKYGTKNINWDSPAKIKGDRPIKRVVIAYKSYSKKEDGSKCPIGKLCIGTAINYHCIADTQSELEDLLDGIADLEYGLRHTIRPKAKKRAILKCLVIYSPYKVKSIIRLEELYELFGR